MADLPEPWGVLYANPNSNGERKLCSNCRFFHRESREKSKCDILPVPVTGEMVCGYHIEKGKTAEPSLSGLTTVPGGTSCDRCRFYEAESKKAGICHAVEVDGEPAEVKALGCCARFEEGEDEENS